MGANAQTSVPTFTAGEVLTAANMNISARTGIPVFADATARDAAFGGTGEKTLAEGQYAYLESTNQTLVYDGSSWISVGTTPGLVLISSTTIGTTVSSVTVSNVFSSTYDNYKIIISGGVGSTHGSLRMILGATNTNYYWNGFYGGIPWASTLNADASAGSTTSWAVGNFSTNSLFANIELSCPNLAKVTSYSDPTVKTSTSDGFFGNFGGFLNDTTQYTAFTVTTTTGTVTGGTIKVYGYQNS